MMSQHHPELDSVFVKALKLLQSRQPDSAKQLRAMLDEAILQRRGGKALEKSTSEKPKPDIFRKTEKTDMEKKEVEKKNPEKVKRDLSEDSSEHIVKKPKMTSFPVTSSTSSVKKSKSDSPNAWLGKKPGSDSPKSGTSLSSGERDRISDGVKKVKDVDKGDREKKVTKERETDKAAVISSDSEESNMDADDFAFDMGISCVSCGKFDVTSKNQLVECQGCHNLYHQECHKPAITEDVNDPRFVWYCWKCAKNLKKMVTAKQQKHKPLGATAPKESSVKPKDTPLMAFKRVEPVKPSSKEQSQAHKASGWASLTQYAGGKSDVKSGKSDNKSAHSKSLSTKSPSSSKVVVLSSGSAKSSGSGTDSSSSDKSRLQLKKKSSKSHDKKK